MAAQTNSETSGGLPALRKEITDLVARNAVAMVQCAIDGAMEEGQYQAIKYLFELVGIYPANASEADEPQDTLSKVLLRQLGVAIAEGEEPADNSEEGESHPVK